MKTQLLFILIILFSSLTQARTWQKIDIPGAHCGNGEVYSVYLSHKDSDKLLIEFMGGGACWSEGTCYGSSPLTRLTPLPGDPQTTVLAQESSKNPWSRHSALFFPYCTGDVFAGTHEAHYKPGVTLYHTGYTNVEAALAHLSYQGLISFQDLRDVTVWGWSAGAIGAFLHTETLRPYLNSNTRRTLIADSPGLHFGKNFWRKFTPQLTQDYLNQFAKIGLLASVDDGFIAPLMGPVFLRLDQWELGILQSTKDMVMSMVFGNITPEAHRSLVLGPSGIAAIAAPYSNVKTWIADVVTHTFLQREQTASVKDMKGETAWDFALRVYMGEKKNPAVSSGVLSGIENQVVP
ncbi:MAG: hypothetical protein OM95_04615 [Bdellovibrio sp. ArHS]|uniref:pectin acetylesterase-family hydrolase n=1 Tax=Bdellovibrio sp. ArHS TaxID=1569284 RepID=UPI000582D90B|nr:pectin acetylesterase-family hydrolase [Bdellovibrio sp. ArHS]KHD89116.1 MAG: hypothetical protein OM95_04615 [Bdellovibrio sp. ArHS]